MVVYGVEALWSGAFSGDVLMYIYMYAWLVLCNKGYGRWLCHTQTHGDTDSWRTCVPSYTVSPATDCDWNGAATMALCTCVWVYVCVYVRLLELYTLATSKVYV